MADNTGNGGNGGNGQTKSTATKKKTNSDSGASAQKKLFKRIAGDVEHGRIGTDLALSKVLTVLSGGSEKDAYPGVTE